ncbi:hypothetical protein C8F01DRAFT_1294381 [Mycena amicta]|nr:hypothetical protein C8F01DRAFT_1294381 [Mycena amicta]
MTTIHDHPSGHPPRRSSHKDEAIGGRLRQSSRCKLVYPSPQARLFKPSMPTGMEIRHSSSLPQPPSTPATRPDAKEDIQCRINTVNIWDSRSIERWKVDTDNRLECDGIIDGARVGAEIHKQYVPRLLGQYGFWTQNVFWEVLGILEPDVNYGARMILGTRVTWSSWPRAYQDGQKFVVLLMQKIV